MGIFGECEGLLGRLERRGGLLGLVRGLGWTLGRARRPESLARRSGRDNARDGPGGKRGAGDAGRRTAALSLGTHGGRGSSLSG